MAVIRGWDVASTTQIFAINLRRRVNALERDAPFLNAKQRPRKPQGLYTGNMHGYLGRVDEAERSGNQPRFAKVENGTANIMSSSRRQVRVRQQSCSGQKDEMRTPQQNQTNGFLEMQTQIQEQIKQLS